jgi:hypothetical protein
LSAAGPAQVDVDVRPGTWADQDVVLSLDVIQFFVDDLDDQLDQPASDHREVAQVVGNLVRAIVLGTGVSDWLGVAPKSRTKARTKAPMTGYRHRSPGRG